MVFICSDIQISGYHERGILCNPTTYQDMYYCSIMYVHMHIHIYWCIDYICQLTYICTVDILSVQKYLHAYIIKHVLMYICFYFLMLFYVRTSYTSSSMDSCLQWNLLVRYHCVLLTVSLKCSTLYWVCILGKYICVYTLTYVYSCFLHAKILCQYLFFKH